MNETSSRNPSRGTLKRVSQGLYRYTPSGAYFAHLRIGGKLFRESLRTKDRREAEQRLADFRRQKQTLDTSLGRLTLRTLSDRYEATLKLKNYIIAALLLIVPIGLIVRQPDLGTALLISAAGAYVLFLAGLSWRIIIGLGIAAAACLPFVWGMMHDYQRQRILTLIDPTQDPLGTGYHTIQSTIAVGSGGLVGKGWLQGTQTHLDFIPERTTDFIFAVFSEEWGLFGNVTLLVLFLLVIGRGVVITANAPTLFTRLFGGAITLTFFTYAFVNMGMVSGILPVVGVPLPLVSYGGTSLVTICLGLGILMSIETHKKLVQS